MLKILKAQLVDKLILLCRTNFLHEIKLLGVFDSSTDQKEADIVNKTFISIDNNILIIATIPCTDKSSQHNFWISNAIHPSKSQLATLHG